MPWIRGRRGPCGCDSGCFKLHDFQSLCGNTRAQPQDLDPDQTIVNIEVEDHTGFYFLRFDDSRLIKTEIECIFFAIDL